MSSLAQRHNAHNPLWRAIVLALALLLLLFVPAAASGTPIYLPGRDRPIGHVDGRFFRKFIVGSKHMLRSPRAIAFDVCTLDDAERAGATHASITDSESGHTYVAPIDTIRKYGFPVVRGHGRQVALALDYWSINGATPAAEQRAAATNKERTDLQLGLFGGAA